MSRSRMTRVLAGGLLGLAWAAGFRAYMSELAGGASHFDWVGTFGEILLPAALVGAALGLAEDLRRLGGAPHWRWLAAAPAILAIVPLLRPGAIPVLLTTGLGGGAVAVALIGVLGGYASSARGSRAGRIAAGTVAAALAVGLVATVPAIGGARLALTEPRGAWVAVLALTSMTTLALACSIPFRAVTSPAASTRLAPARTASSRTRHRG